MGNASSAEGSPRRQQKLTKQRPLKHAGQPSDGGTRGYDYAILSHGERLSLPPTLRRRGSEPTPQSVSALICPSSFRARLRRRSAMALTTKTYHAATQVKSEDNSFMFEHSLLQESYKTAPDSPAAPRRHSSQACDNTRTFHCTTPLTRHNERDLYIPSIPTKHGGGPASTIPNVFGDQERQRKALKLRQTPLRRPVPLRNSAHNRRSSSAIPVHTIRNFAYPPNAAENLTMHELVSENTTIVTRSKTEENERPPTPSDLAYKQLGGLEFGSLRIVNGSPAQNTTPTDIVDLATISNRVVERQPYSQISASSKDRDVAYLSDSEKLSPVNNIIIPEWQNTTITTLVEPRVTLSDISQNYPSVSRVIRATSGNKSAFSYDALDQARNSSDSTNTCTTTKGLRVCQGGNNLNPSPFKDTSYAASDTPQSQSLTETIHTSFRGSAHSTKIDYIYDPHPSLHLNQTVGNAANKDWKSERPGSGTSSPSATVATDQILAQLVEIDEAIDDLSPTWRLKEASASSSELDDACAFHYEVGDNSKTGEGREVEIVEASDQSNAVVLLRSTSDVPLEKTEDSACTYSSPLGQGDWRFSDLQRKRKELVFNESGNISLYSSPSDDGFSAIPARVKISRTIRNDSQKTNPKIKMLCPECDSSHSAMDPCARCSNTVSDRKVLNLTRFPEARPQNLLHLSTSTGPLSRVADSLSHDDLAKVGLQVARERSTSNDITNNISALTSLTNNDQYDIHRTSLQQPQAVRASVNSPLRLLEAPLIPPKSRQRYSYSVCHNQSYHRGSALDLEACTNWPLPSNYDSALQRQAKTPPPVSMRTRKSQPSLRARLI